MTPSGAREGPGGNGAFGVFVVRVGLVGSCSHTLSSRAITTVPGLDLVTGGRLRTPGLRFACREPFRVPSRRLSEGWQGQAGKEGRAGDPALQNTHMAPGDREGWPAGAGLAQGPGSPHGACSGQTSAASLSPSVLSPRLSWPGRKEPRAHGHQWGLEQGPH